MVWMSFAYVATLYPTLFISLRSLMGDAAAYATILSLEVLIGQGGTLQVDCILFKRVVCAA